MTVQELHDALKESGTSPQVLALVIRLGEEHDGDTQAVVDRLEELAHQFADNTGPPRIEGKLPYQRVTMGTVVKARVLVPKVEAVPEVPEAEEPHEPSEDHPHKASHPHGHKGRQHKRG